jgi:hypothetical protein
MSSRHFVFALTCVVPAPFPLVVVTHGAAAALIPIGKKLWVHRCCCRSSGVACRGSCECRSLRRRRSGGSSSYGTGCCDTRRRHLHRCTGLIHLLHSQCKTIAIGSLPCPFWRTLATVSTHGGIINEGNSLCVSGFVIMHRNPFLQIMQSPPHTRTPVAQVVDASSHRSRTINCCDKLTVAWPGVL